MKYQLEICANSINSAIAANNGGANRIELCTNMAEGGTSPSYGTIEWCLKNLKIEVWPLIRPRGGNFVYSDAEFNSLLKDIAICQSIGCHGVVTGILLENGKIDIGRCKQIINTAQGMPLAFHRAFDRCLNPFEALEELIALGFVRVLTSGQQQQAIDGLALIKQLLIQAGGRIEIMPGSGILPGNLQEIARRTNATSFHTTAKKQKTIDSTYPTIFDREDKQWLESSEELVKELVVLLNNL